MKIHKTNKQSVVTVLSYSQTDCQQTTQLPFCQAIGCGVENMLNIIGTGGSWSYKAGTMEDDNEKMQSLSIGKSHESTTGLL